MRLSHSFSLFAAVTALFTVVTATGCTRPTPPLASSGTGTIASVPPEHPAPPGSSSSTSRLPEPGHTRNGGEGEGEGEGAGTSSAGEGEGSAAAGEGEGEGSVVVVGGEGEGEGAGSGGGGNGGTGTSQVRRVLLIGNSQLGPAEFNANLAAGLEELSVAVDGASHFTVDRVQENGQDCAGFLADGTGPGTPLERAGSGDYDVVILIPDLSEPKDGSIACFDNFRTVATNAGSTFGVMATASFSGEYPQGFTSMHDGLLAYASSHPGTLFVPAGKAWQILLGTDTPTLDQLYVLYSDLAHPGVRGYTMYIYTLWDVLRSASSVGLTRDFPALRCDMTQPCLTQAQLEQCAAANTCSSTANGVELDGNGNVAVTTATQAAAYQQAADAAVAQSQP